MHKLIIKRRMIYMICSMIQRTWGCIVSMSSRPSERKCTHSTDDGMWPQRQRGPTRVLAEIEVQRGVATWLRCGDLKL